MTKKLYLLIAALTVIFLADFISYPFLQNLEYQSANKGANGIWLRYLWYFGKHSQTDEEKLFAQLNKGQFKYAYLHVRSIKADGSLEFHHKETARPFLIRMHTAVPNCKRIAWVYAGTATANGGVDLSKESVRSKMVQEAIWLIRECGFDGIQWDYEFASNNNPNLLKLLDETRAQLRKNEFLSVATPMWYPLTLWGWDDPYFKRVCSRCDQIAVMCYDSFFYYPRAYAWLLNQQCKHLIPDANVANSNCEVMLGVPSYEKGTAGHLTLTENLRVALPAISKSISSAKPSTKSFAGVAIFAEYTTDENEWNDYYKLWLKHGP